MIKAVIFDADGPLYFRTSEIKNKKQALLAEFNFDGILEDFEAAYDKEKFKGYVRAETAEEMFQNILRVIGIEASKDDARSFTKKFDAIQRQVTPGEGAIAALKKLKSAGYKTCVLTDSFYSSEEKWTWFKKLGMDGYLEYMVSSYDIRKLKDTPEAYQACLDLMDVRADEAVFVGHQEYEMVGARAANVTSIAVTPIATPGIHSDHAIHSLLELPDLLAKLSQA